MTDHRNAFTPASRHRSRGHAQRLAEHDNTRRATAAKITRKHPHWLVLWGPHSREFWAYPCLNATGFRGKVTRDLAVS